MGHGMVQHCMAHDAQSRLLSGSAHAGARTPSSHRQTHPHALNASLAPLVAHRPQVQQFAAEVLCSLVVREPAYRQHLAAGKQFASLLPMLSSRNIKVVACSAAILSTFARDVEPTRKKDGSVRDPHGGARARMSATCSLQLHKSVATALTHVGSHPAHVVATPIAAWFHLTHGSARTTELQSL